VSDHPLDLVGLRALVEAQPDLAFAGAAVDPASAREIVSIGCDVLVLSAPFPGLCIPTFVLHYRQEKPEAKIIALTDFIDSTMASELMDSGADGCLLKRSAPTDLIAAIRKTLVSGRHFDPAFAVQLNGNTAAASLSERERRVLKLVARGYTSKEIAAKLELSIRTIETYKTRSMRKLNLRTRADVVRYGVERGWIQNL
jgi:DNA-binding NarL/FixJ family response regulator